MRPRSYLSFSDGLEGGTGISLARVMHTAQSFSMSTPYDPFRGLYGWKRGRLRRLMGRSNIISLTNP